MNKTTLHKITKEIGQQLLEISCMLPEIPVATSETKSGLEVLDAAAKGEIKLSQKIDPNKIYTVKSGGSLQAVNHLKRLRSAYIQNGVLGVDKYLEPFKKKSA